jgi:hypothetical protein
LGVTASSTTSSPAKPPGAAKPVDASDVLSIVAGNQAGLGYSGASDDVLSRRDFLHHGRNVQHATESGGRLL